MLLLLSKLTESKYNSPNDLRKALKGDLGSVVRELYFKVYKMHLSGCSNCLEDAYYQLIKLNKANMLKEDNRRFVMANGAIIIEDTKDGTIYYTHKNIDDKTAERLLRANPSYKTKFSVIPTDFNDEPEVTDKTEVTEVKSKRNKSK